MQLAQHFNRGVARNFMKMKAAKRISKISAEAQHYLECCRCAQRRLRSACAYTDYMYKQYLCRSSDESLAVSRISAKQ